MGFHFSPFSDIFTLSMHIQNQKGEEKTTKISRFYSQAEIFMTNIKYETHSREICYITITITIFIIIIIMFIIIFIVIQLQIFFGPVNSSLIFWAF